MKLNFSLFSLALLFAFLLSACSNQMEESLEEVGATPLAKTLVQSKNLFALVPDNHEQAYKMELSLFSDGTAEAVRSIVAYDGNQDYDDYHYVGLSNITQTNNEVVASFSGDTWFIPFDAGVNTERVFYSLGGSMSGNCICQGGLGQCDETLSIGIFGGASSGCDGYFCEGYCSSSFSIGGGFRSFDSFGVFVSALSVAAF